MVAFYKSILWFCIIKGFGSCDINCILPQNIDWAENAGPLSPPTLDVGLGKLKGVNAHRGGGYCKETEHTKNSGQLSE